MTNKIALTVEIEKPVYGGSFLAHTEGKALFVPLALPGEQVRVHVADAKGSFAEAEVESIEHASVARIAPHCPHFSACGGCHYQHTDADTQLAFKKQILRETLERGSVPAPDEIHTLCGEPWAYRNRVRLTFNAAGQIGYRGRRSHEVIPIASCPIAAPVLMDAAFAMADLMRPSAPSRRPAEMTLFCNADGSRVLARLEFARAPKDSAEKLADAIATRVPALAGLEIVVQCRGGQPSRAISRWGEPSLLYHAAGFEYRVDQGAFFQVNRQLVDALVERVTAHHSGQLAWDLFAGVGLFARRLTAQFERVVAVESAPASTQALAANLKFTRSTPVRATTLDFLRRDHGDVRPDLVVIDPPRTGLGSAVTSELIRISPPTLVYVSCDPATLARDLRAFTQAGYAIHSVTLVDLFPQTFHLESVVELRRN
jgi:23S rRNA (uracil1939-C5)-methyltransferase